MHHTFHVTSLEKVFVPLNKDVVICLVIVAIIKAIDAKENKHIHNNTLKVSVIVLIFILSPSQPPAYLVHRVSSKHPF